MIHCLRTYVFKDGKILFSHFKTPEKPLDVILTPLMSDEDVPSLLNMGKVIEEIMGDDNAKNKTKTSTSKVIPLGKGSNESISGFSDSDSTDYPPWSSEKNPFHGGDDEQETEELFVELDQLLKHVAFLNVELKEHMVGVNASFVFVDALVVHVDAIVIAFEELLERVKEIERLRNRKRENKDESASGNVPFGRPNIR
nr:hypothetical protein [Tanacetum cinerariifolium]